MVTSVLASVLLWIPSEFTACGAESRSSVDEAQVTQRIDKLVDEGLRQAGLEPNPRTDDATFLRRSYLQITGAIPTLEQASRFFESNAPDKRARLIDELLSSPGYSSHFFNFWADLFRIKVRRNDPYAQWVRDSLHENKPYDRFVRELVSAKGHLQDVPAVGYFLRDANMPLDNAANTAQIFLGTQIGCAQYHNHPFEAWTQKQFYQCAAFTYGINWRYPKNRVEGASAIVDARIDLTDVQKKAARTTLMRSVYDVVSDSAQKKLRIPDDYPYDDAKAGDVVEPKPLFEPAVGGDLSASPRDAFAVWLTSPENPRFTLVIASRMWKRAFGLGLIEPVDDITDSTVASNPELMAYLTQLMRDVRFDLKAYQRILYNTAAWQRACGTQDEDPEQPYRFAGPILQRLTSEQVWDSVMTLSADDINESWTQAVPGPDPLQPCFSIFTQSDQELAAQAIALRA